MNAGGQVSTSLSSFATEKKRRRAPIKDPKLKEILGQRKELEKELKKKKKEFIRTKKELKIQEEKQKKAMKKEKEKEKEKPKRVMTAFSFFVQDNFHSMKASYPDSPLKDLMSKLSAKWNALSPEQKQVYQQKSEEDKKRKEKDMQVYLEAHPKRPLNGYLLFCQQKRPEVVKSNPQVPISQIAKLLGERWNALSENEKEVFNRQYKAALQTFNKKHA